MSFCMQKMRHSAATMAKVFTFLLKFELKIFLVIQKRDRNLMQMRRLGQSILIGYLSRRFDQSTVSITRYNSVTMKRQFLIDFLPASLTNHTNRLSNQIASPFQTLPQNCAPLPSANLAIGRSVDDAALIV